MADKKPQKVTRTTPRGEFAGFIAVNEPNTKFKEAGEYKIAIALPADSEWAQKAVKAIDKAADEALAEAIKNDQRKPADQKKKPWKLNDQKAYDNETDDEGNETGRVVFKFGAAASGVRKKDGKPWKKTIKLFDAKGKPTKANPWKGSEGCISFTMGGYAVTPNVGAGCKLSLEAVQIIKLVTGGEGKDADGYGFGSHDNGYDASDEAEETSTNTSKDASDAQAGVAGTDDDEDF